MVPNIFNLVKYTPAVYGERDLMTVRGPCRCVCVFFLWILFCPCASLSRSDAGRSLLRCMTLTMQPLFSSVEITAPAPVSAVLVTLPPQSHVVS